MTERSSDNRVVEIGGRSTGVNGTSGARTHEEITARWSGHLVELAAGRAPVRLRTLPEMRADARGLVHGGFVFSLADHCAMLAVNEPNVVLASVEMSFLAPVAVGETVEAAGRVTSSRGRKHQVEVTVVRDAGGTPVPVARGAFSCVVTDRHVLDGPAPRQPAAPAGGSDER